MKTCTGKADIHDKEAAEGRCGRISFVVQDTENGVNYMIHYVCTGMSMKWKCFS